MVVHINCSTHTGRKTFKKWALEEEKSSSLLSPPFIINNMMNNTYLTVKQKRLNQLLHVSNHYYTNFYAPFILHASYQNKKPLWFSSKITGTVCNNTDTDTNTNKNKVIETDSIILYCIFVYFIASCHNAASDINA